MPQNPRAPSGSGRQPAPADLAREGLPISDFDRAFSLHREGRVAEALPLYRRAAAETPARSEALYLLGLAHCQTGDLGPGTVLIRRSLDVAPAGAEPWGHLGNALAALERYSAAARAYRRALTLAPGHAEALANLASVHAIERQPAPAETGFRRALALAPLHAPAAYGLALLLREQGRLAPAAAAFSILLRGHPGHAEAHEKLATVLLAQQRFAASLAHARQACALKPAGAEIHHTLAKIHAAADRIPDAVISYRRTLALSPGDAEAHSNLIFALDFDPRQSIEAQQAVRRAWYERHAALLPRSEPHVARVPGRRLRIGYVSADFRHHSAAYGFGGLIFARDPSRFEAVLYSGVTSSDDLTGRFRAAADLWRDCATLPDDALAAQIVADRIDILVDLSAHTGGNRLAVFARKPAPVQVTGWGQATGTGLPTIDWFMADPVLVPGPARRFFAEQIVDLPCFMSYAPPAHAPEVTVRPDGPPAFGCLNRLSKVSGDALDVWGALLRRMPTARLLMKDPALDDPSQRERILAALRRRGVAPDRVALRGRTPHREHLATYGEVDVALDPFPHNGGITSFEALWMGVPVVALLGRTLPGRASGAILHALGPSKWAATSTEDYIGIATALIADREELRRRRETLRETLANSVVCDPVRYCRAVEEAYREMWRAYCTHGEDRGRAG